MKDRNACVGQCLDHLRGAPQPTAGFITFAWHLGAERLAPVLVRPGAELPQFVTHLRLHYW